MRGSIEGSTARQAVEDQDLDWEDCCAGTDESLFVSHDGTLR